MIVTATGKLRFTTANPAGVLYDPEDLTITLRDPFDAIGDGQEYVYVEGNPDPITRTALGEFLLQVVLAVPGRWHWRVRALDPGDANRIDISEGSFSVDFSRVVSNA